LVSENISGTSRVRYKQERFQGGGALFYFWDRNSQGDARKDHIIFARMPTFCTLNFTNLSWIPLFLLVSFPTQWHPIATPWWVCLWLKCICTCAGGAGVSKSSFMVEYKYLVMKVSGKVSSPNTRTNFTCGKVGVAQNLKPKNSLIFSLSAFLSSILLLSRK
jgi:hypothetical protein